MWWLGVKDGRASYANFNFDTFDSVFWRFLPISTLLRKPCVQFSILTLFQLGAALDYGAFEPNTETNDAKEQRNPWQNDGE